MLISLAVIFVPMMFDEPHDERAVRSLDIPEEPPFPEVDVPEQDESMSGVPDYRLEEVDPAPTPEVVEDPAMGSQPADSSEAQAGPDNDAQTADSAGAPSGETSGQASPAPSQDTVSEQAATSEPAPDTASAEPDASGEGDFERTLEGAWVLQLGSFGNEDNARRLRDGIRDRGYGAHLQEVVRDDNRLTRVFSGPFAEKAEAEKAKQVLDEAFGVQSLVTRGDG